MKKIFLALFFSLFCVTGIWSSRIYLTSHVYGWPYTAEKKVLCAYRCHLYGEIPQLTRPELVAETGSGSITMILAKNIWT